MIQAYIALGSNLQDPTQHVFKALGEIDAIKNTQLMLHSSLYLNPPFGIEDQPDFINAVAKVVTDLSPQELLHSLFDIEKIHARVRTQKNGPRTLDLDLLLFGNEEIKTASLTVPHPAMKDRAFVLVPLSEIAPDLILPCGSSVQALVQKMDVTQLKKVLGSAKD